MLYYNLYKSPGEIIMAMNVYLNEYGCSLQQRNGCLVIKKQQKEEQRIALSHLKVLHIHTPACTITSSLILECALRGIPIFIHNSFQKNICSLMGAHQISLVRVRELQFRFVSSPRAYKVASMIIYGKLRNQRNLILYRNKNSVRIPQVQEFIADVDTQCNRIKAGVHDTPELMGIEGSIAQHYWTLLRVLNLVPPSFLKREKRGAKELMNSALNYGYAILQSRIFQAIHNAGLEPYLGILHAPRPGRPSLVLDLMEEYRSFVVDLNVLKATKTYHHFTNTCKKALINNIENTLGKSYPYRKKRVKLEAIIQRQVYQLLRVMDSKKEQYRPYIFKW